MTRFVVATSLGCFGCAADDGPSAGTDAAGTVTGEGGEASASRSSSGSATPPPMSTSGSTAAETATPTGPTSSDESSTGARPAEPGVHVVGRYDQTDPAALRMGWSGAGLVVRFDGIGVAVNMDDQARVMTVVVDGTVMPRLATTAGAQDYTLASDLPAGEHTVELYRRTEGSFGPTIVHDVMIDGELLPPPAVARRVEVIGDSITAGYGNEGVAPCSFSADTENHYLTYGALAARTLGAEVQTVAWSGKGVIYNYGDDTNEPLPELYDRTVATERAAWGFEWQPDAVVVNLGTNDFSTDNDPPQALFVDSYVAFAEHLRAVYPEAFILLVAPSLFGSEVALVEGYLGDVVAARATAGDTNVAFADINVEWIGSGCDGHPTVATHEGMAARLAEELQLQLRW